MSKVCDEDCFNCKFDDCIMDGLGRAPAPKKELKQDPRNIRRRNYWREHSEELNAKKKSSLCSAQRGDQCQEAEKDKGEKKMQIGDTIKCSSMEEATEYGKQLLAQGWDVKSESDFRTGKWILTITGKKEPKAADDESKYPDMDEMIKACEEKKDPDETIVFAFGVGRMVPLPFDKKAVKKGIEEGLKFIKKLDGFLGVHPIDVDRNLLLFDTLNNAKGGSNMLKSKDVPVGQIVPILIKTEFLEGKNGH